MCVWVVIAHNARECFGSFVTSVCFLSWLARARYTASLVMHLFRDLQKEAMNGKENTFVIDCFVGNSFTMNVIFPCTPSGI